MSVEKETSHVNTLDIHKLTRTQILDLLKEKEEQDLAANVETGVTDTDIPKCSFKPIRGKNVCVDNATVFYGCVQYCKKHSKSVQALKAKDNYNTSMALSGPISTDTPPEAVETVSIAEPNEAKTEVVPTTETSKENKVRTPAQKSVVTDIVSSPLESSLESSTLDEHISKKTINSKASSDLSIVPLPDVEKSEDTTSKVVSHTKQKIASVAKPSVKKAESPVRVVKKPSPAKKLVIKRNQWGRFEDPETSIVFDPESKMAFGIQHFSGSVRPLSAEKIAICQRNHWDYFQPVEEDDESETNEDGDEDDESVENEEEDGEEDEEDDEDDEDEEDDESVANEEDDDEDENDGDDEDENDGDDEDENDGDEEDEDEDGDEEDEDEDGDDESVANEEDEDDDESVANEEDGDDDEANGQYY